MVGLFPLAEDVQFCLDAVMFVRRQFDAPIDAVKDPAEDFFSCVPEAVALA